MNNVRTGALVRELARQSAEVSKKTDFVTQVREGTIGTDRYLGYIASMYPVVVGFCGGLSQMIGRFDSVKDARVLQGLGRQLTEEIGHNNLWRGMLKSFGIDHVKLYEDYLTDPDSIFPVPVMVMCRYLRVTSAMPIPWIHFACQGAIEATLLEVVTECIYPGVRDCPRLNTGPASIAWWKEHTSEIVPGERESAEVRHLRIAESILDQEVTDPALQESIRGNVDTITRLFAHTTKWHDSNSFPIKKYLASR